jgi:hypothetical protein
MKNKINKNKCLLGHPLVYLRTEVLIKLDGSGSDLEKNWGLRILDPEENISKSSKKKLMSLPHIFHVSENKLFFRKQIILKLIIRSLTRIDSTH